MTKALPNQDIIASVEQLLERIGSLQLATVDESGHPSISYTPYLMREDRFYIFISELAAHTGNLKQSPNCQIMLIEDEADTKNIFARKRLILKCHAAFLERTHPNWESCLEAFEQKHGNTVSLLKTLKDFWLIELQPTEGSFVQGFAQAFAFQGMDFGSAQQVSGR